MQRTPRLGLGVLFGLPVVHSYSGRRDGMGRGILKVVAAVPIPNSHVLGGTVAVYPLRADGYSAAQNIYPSIPRVVPAPLGATVCRKFAKLFCSEEAKLLQFAMLPLRYRDPVNFAGASGGTGGEYCGLPSICSCQSVGVLDEVPPTMALA